MEEIQKIALKKRFIGLCLKVVLYVPKIYDIVIIEMKSQQSFSLTKSRTKRRCTAAAYFFRGKIRFKEGKYEDTKHNPRLHETRD